jgi:predicted nucleotidyltransferase
VITPTLEGPVLRALAGVDLPLTRSQIGNLTEGASEAGIRKTLARLVDQGIVLEEQVGSRFTYRANRVHLLWPSVEGLFSARQILADRVASTTGSWQIQPITVELFGSVAQGSSNADSDVDLLIVRPTLDAESLDIWDDQVADLRDRVTRWTGNSCDIVTLDRDELTAARERNDPIVSSPMTTLTGHGLKRISERRT